MTNVNLSKLCPCSFHSKKTNPGFGSFFMMKNPEVLKKLLQRKVKCNALTHGWI